MGQKRSLSHVVMGQDCPRWNDKYAEDPVLKPVLFREVELDHAVRDILMVSITDYYLLLPGTESKNDRKMNSLMALK